MLDDFLLTKGFLYDNLVNQYSKEILKEILNSYQSKRYTTFRLNLQKGKSKQDIIDLLNSLNIEYEISKIYDNAFIIKNDNGINIFDLDIFKNGEIYVQSLSSMLPSLIMQPKNKTDILDMASAPGGKTTLMSNLAPLARITACEKDKIRAEKLKYNIAMQNAKNCVAMVKDSLTIEDYYKFDSILLDAPCSGVGTIQLENEKTYKFISQKLITNSSILQKKLLNKAINICKKGGTIVYSTCSILKEENEDVVIPFIKENKVKVENILYKDIPLLPCKIDGALCVKPSQEFEGFFVCKLTKL